MSGVICLQGGGEFSPACRPMDAELLRRAAGRVVVTALAGAPGREYDVATGNGVRHFLAAGAEDVVGAPDARVDPQGALDAARSARLLVLPGGSPARLLSALTSTGLREVLATLLADDGVVMGASAGAMVLCPWTVLPERRSARGPAVAEGLDLVRDLLVVPHWAGGSRGRAWLRAVDAAVPETISVLGIPEESGVVVEGSAVTAVGVAPTRLIRAGRDIAVGETWQLP